MLSIGKRSANILFMSDRLTRRDFLKVAAGGIGGVAATRLLKNEVRNPENESLLRCPAIVGFCDGPIPENGSFSLAKVIGPEGQVGEVLRTMPDDDGTFFFEGIEPGEYQVAPNFMSPAETPRKIIVDSSTKIAFGGIFETLSAPSKPKRFVPFRREHLA